MSRIAAVVIGRNEGDRLIACLKSLDGHVEQVVYVDSGSTDGSREALGVIVNPLVYGYGLPLLFGLVMASSVSLLRKLLTMLIGYSAVMLVQVWGVVWQSLKTLSFNFGPEVHQVVA